MKDREKLKYVLEKKKNYYQEMGLEAQQCVLQVGLPQVSVIPKSLLLLR